MKAYPLVTLKRGKETPLRAGHPWVFSNAIEVSPEAAPGELVEVVTREGASLGLGTWNPHTSIRVRLLTHDREARIGADFFAERFRALSTWKTSRLPAETTGFRLVHAETDVLPGLIVDRYDDVFVFQLHTAGMERMRKEIVAGLQKAFSPRAIVERSDVEARKTDGLTDLPVGVLHGAVEGPVAFTEAGVKFLTDVLRGQKTGFFLDQRDARLRTGELASGRRVLNLFGYTGGFSVHAAMGGAAFTATVDASRSALELAERNFRANGLDPEDEKRCLFLEADVMDLLADRAWPGAPYDVIVCDPPAFAKHETQVARATKAYTDLNRACLESLAPGGILITSSCSGRVDPEAFRSLLRIAAGRAKRDVRLIGWLGHPIDHAERLAYPEGRYLKTAILEVTAILP